MRALILAALVALHARAASATTAAPDVVATLALPAGGRVTDVRVGGRWLYVATAKRRALPELFVFDATDPAAPAPVGTLEVGATVRATVPSLDVAVADGAFVPLDVAYLLTDDPTRDVVVVDLADRTAPAVLATVDLPTRRRALAAAISYPYLFVGTGADRSHGTADLWVVDVSRPAAPVVVASLALGADVTGVAVRHWPFQPWHAIVTTADPTREVRVVAFDGAGAPAEVGHVDLPGKGRPRGLDRDGDVVTVVVGRSGRQPDLWIVDASTPAAPAILGAVDLDADAVAVASERDLAYVATRAPARGVVVVDVSNRAAPAPLADVALPSGGVAAAFHLGVAYVASAKSAQGVAVLDPRAAARPPFVDRDGDGVRTLLCLGDSNTDASWWSGPSWPEQLATRFADAGIDDVAVVNRGHGFGTAFPFGTSIGGNSNWARDHLQTAFADGVPADGVVFAYGTNDTIIPYQPEFVPYAALLPVHPILPDVVVAAYDTLVAAAEQDWPGIPALVALTPRHGFTIATGGGVLDPNDRLLDVDDALLRHFHADRIVDFARATSFPADYLPGPPVDPLHFGVAGQGKRAQAAFDRIVLGR